MTTYADMYYFEEKSLGRHGKRVCAASWQTIIGFPVPDASTPADGLARAERFIKEFKGDALIVPAVAPHALYTNDEATLKAAAALARRYDVPLIIHLAETEDEVNNARQQHQATPVGYLESIGFWGPRTLAAHGVWVNDADVQILKRRGMG
jgi:5-methylthioadenosine/S-adenosylhomocysteine deaminase